MPMSQCIICSKMTLSRCHGCKSTSYCSTACQRRDYPLHKLLCSKYIPFLRDHPRPIVREADRERESFQLAIVLPVDEPELDFMWVRCRYVEEFDDDGELVEYLANVKIDPKFLAHPVPFSTVKHGQRVDVMATRNQSQRKMGVNQTMKMLNEGYDGQVWYGNLLVVHVDELMCGQYVDVNVADLRYAVNSLCAANNLYEIEADNKYLLRDPAGWTKGVRVNCMGDKDSTGAQNTTTTYEEVELRHAAWDAHQIDDDGLKFVLPKSTAHPIFSGTHFSHVARRMRIPILLDPFFCPSDEPCGGLGVVGVIQMVTKTKSMRFAMYPRMHTFTAVRGDRIDMTIHQFNAVVAFLVDVLGQLKEVKSGCEYARRRVVSRAMKWKNFDVFFEGYKQDRISRGENAWKEVVAPERKRYLRGQSQLKNTMNEGRTADKPGDG